MKHLELRRVAAHCLNQLTKQCHLGTKAINFYGDNREDWDVNSDWLVFALHNGRQVAEIAIIDNSATIVVNSWYDLIRDEHLSEFNPYDHGIEVNPEYEIDGITKRPDFKTEGYDFRDTRGLELPEMPIPKAPRMKRARIIASR